MKRITCLYLYILTGILCVSHAYGIEVKLTQQNRPTCSGAANGSISYVVTDVPKNTFDIILDGTYYRSHNVSDVGVEFTIDNLDEDDYMLTVTSTDSTTAVGGAISDSKRFSLLYSHKLSFEAEAFDASCSSDNYIALKNISSATSDVSFSTTPTSNYNSISQRFENLTPGETYTVIGQNGICDAVTLPTTYSVNDYDDPSIVISPTDEIILDCYGGDGTIEVTINGGHPDRKVKIQLLKNDIIEYEYESYYGESKSFTVTEGPTWKVACTDVLDPTCTLETNYTVAGPSSPLDFYVSKTEESCYGSNDGSISINASGGSGVYTYYKNMESQGSNSTINHLRSQTYSVYVEDSNGCIAETQTVVVNGPDPLVLTGEVLDTKNVTCGGGNDGAYYFNVEGGNGTFSYTLTYEGDELYTLNSDILADPITLSNLEEGAYQLEVIDEKACDSKSITFSIDGPYPYNYTVFNYSEILCYGEGADLEVSASGGSGGSLDYQLTQGATIVGNETLSSGSIFQVEDLEAGVYTLRISESGVDCDPLDSTFTISEPDELNILSTEDSISSNCYDEGASYLLSMQGEGPFEFSLNSGSKIPLPDGQTQVEITDIPTSVNGKIFTIEVFDVNDCTKTISGKAYCPSLINITDILPTDVSCNGGSDGTVTMTIHGGTAPYSVEFVGGPTFNDQPSNFSQDNFSAAEYTSINIIDANGCDFLYTTDLKILEPDEFVIAPRYNEDELRCVGDKTEINVDVVSGGTTIITYHIVGDGIDTENNTGIFEVEGGSFEITATNEKGCVNVQAFTMNKPIQLEFEIVSQDNIGCFSAEDAELTINISGGTAPYNYSLTGETSAFASDNITDGTDYTIQGAELLAKTHQLMIRDTYGCLSEMEEVVITEPAEIVMYIDSIFETTCFGDDDGGFKLNVSGGSGGYKYILENSYGDVYPELSYTPSSGLEADDYLVYVEDSKGCQSEVLPVTVPEPDEIIISDASVSQEILCYNDKNGAIEIDALGGYPYDELLYSAVTKTELELAQTYGTNYIVENLKEGFYYAVVTDSRGECRQIYTDKAIELVAPDELIAQPASVQDVSCYQKKDGEVEITHVGGTAPYTIFVYDENGHRIVEEDYDNLGETFYDETETVITDYTFIVTDGNGCSSKEESFNITNPSKLTIEVIDNIQANCYGESNGTIELNASGGSAPYMFSRDGINYNPGLIDDFTLNPNQNSGRGIIISDYLGDQSYTPAVKDNNNCIVAVESSQYIVNPEKLVVDEIVFDNDLFILFGQNKYMKQCSNTNDDKLIIQANGGTGQLSYSIQNVLIDAIDEWSVGDSLFTNLSSGYFPARVLDSKGCITEWEDPVTGATENYISIPEPIEISWAIKEVTCPGSNDGEIEFTIEGGTQPYYTGKDDELFINPIEKRSDNVGVAASIQYKNLVGEHKFYFRDDNNCPALIVDKGTAPEEPSQVLVEYEWKDIDSLIIKSYSVFGVKCSEDSYGKVQFGDGIAGGTSPYNFVLVDSLDVEHTQRLGDEGTHTVSGLREGRYWSEITDANGCEVFIDEASIVEDYPIYIEAENENIDISILDVDQDYGIIHPECPDEASGVIGFEVRNFQTLGVNYTVYRYDEFVDQFEYCHTDSIYTDEEGVKQMEGQDSLFTKEERVNYMLGDTEMNMKFLQGTYIVKVQDTYSECEAQDTVDLIAVEEECPDIQSTNVFTPNNDNVNDLWIVRNLASFTQAELAIYTAYGERVFYKQGMDPDIDCIDATNMNWGWDGKGSNGEDLPSGTYMVSIQLDTNSPVNYYTVSLLRNSGY